MQDTWDAPLPSIPHGWEFPKAKDKEELRGRPRQCWDNGALCPRNQSRGRKAKGRWGPSCLHPGKPCLPGPHPELPPSRVQGDPGQNPAWPTQEEDTGCIRQTVPVPQWSLCVGFPLRREGTISSASFLLGRHHCWGASVPTRVSGAQRGPGLTAERRQGSCSPCPMALSPRGRGSRKDPGNWGGDGD